MALVSLAPWLRVKRGLARTFQINTLFPELDPLEAVTLAVCERLGVAGNWWRPVPALPHGSYLSTPRRQLAHSRVSLRCAVGLADVR